MENNLKSCCGDPCTNTVPESRRLKYSLDIDADNHYESTNEGKLLTIKTGDKLPSGEALLIEFVSFNMEGKHDFFNQFLGKRVRLSIEEIE